MGIVTSLTNGLSEREANDALNAHVSVPPPPQEGRNSAWKEQFRVCCGCPSCVLPVPKPVTELLAAKRQNMAALVLI